MRISGLAPEMPPASSFVSDIHSDLFQRIRPIKRDYAKLAQRPDTEAVMQHLDDWLAHYNTKHPHSAMNYPLPRMFRERQALNNKHHQSCNLRGYFRKRLGSR